MPNRLASEKSPYLLQHAHNPVDWHPWGPEAFDLAKSQNKPVFLSVGYATCHWCHVMAHECFEDAEVAELLNQGFIAIKVDREERPDVDSVYMSVCQALTGSGGWPLSVFLTPEARPFFAGTYFPKRSMMGRPGFMDILTNIAAMWQNDPAKILSTGDQITQAVRPRPATGGAELSQRTIEKAFWSFSKAFDPKYGGFGAAPKFPTPHNLSLLLRWHARDDQPRALAMVEATLDAMRRGGIFDQVGYGFHRYSVDPKWLVPHFEKMLYDQAQLAIAYLEAYQVTGKTAYADTARQVFTYVLRDLTSPEGAFYSAEDADSEGSEGLFYVWTPQQVKAVLGEEAGALFCRYYGIVTGGNFEHGLSIPHVTRDVSALTQQTGREPDDLLAELEASREKLLAQRGKRPRPLLDDKVLTAWNGLMIAALAKGAQVLGVDQYRRAASKAAGFVLDKLSDDTGRLLRRWRLGEARHQGCLEDYAFLAWGLIELYQAGFDPDHLERAIGVMEKAHELFWDELHHGYWYTPTGGEELILREKDLYDGALPSGNSVMALNLLRLGKLCGDPKWQERASRLMDAFSAQVDQNPMAHCHFLMALDFALGPGQEVVVAGEADDPATRALFSVAQKLFLPGGALLLRPGGPDGKRIAALAPFTKDMKPTRGRPAAYVCRGFACQQPVGTVADLLAALK